MEQQILGVVENTHGARSFQFGARHPAAEHADARHSGAHARLRVPDRVAHENRPVGRCAGPVQGDPDDVRPGLATSTSADEVTAATRSSQSSALRKTASSSSGAEVASTTDRSSPAIRSSSRRAPGSGVSNSAVWR